MEKPDHPNPPLVSLVDEIDHCAKCGACRSVCPVFAEVGLEKAAARGKIAVCQAVADGTLPLTESLHAVVDDCLLCLTCVENCSRAVQTHTIVTTARAALFRMRTEAAAEKPDRSGGSRPEGIPETSGLAYYFLNDTGRTDLPIVDAPFLDRKTTVLKAENASATVGFFTGCFINHVYPDIGEAVVRVLNAVGVTVVLHEGQVCCGAPMTAAGDRGRARCLAAENIGALDGDHPIVTACASGERMLKQAYPELFEKDDPRRETAEALAARTVDIATYLAETVGLDAVASKVERRYPEAVTYHDPCQLNRGLKIRTAPRALLKAACGENFRESRQAARCCGAGAVYGTFHPDTSEKIRSRKIRDILDSGARTVATGCPSCIRQIAAGFRAAGSPHRVVHTIEILDRCMFP